MNFDILICHTAAFANAPQTQSTKQRQPFGRNSTTGRAGRYCLNMLGGVAGFFKQFAAGSFGLLIRWCCPVHLRLFRQEVQSCGRELESGIARPAETFCSVVTAIMMAAPVALTRSANSQWPSFTRARNLPVYRVVRVVWFICFSKDQRFARW